MNIIFILVAVYLYSAILMWRYMHLTHSNGGIRSKLSPGVEEVVITIVPFLNTAGLLLLVWLDKYPIETKPCSFDRFFNIKK